MKFNFTFVTPVGWARNEELEDSTSAVFTTDKNTRVVISRYCGLYNVFAEKEESEGKVLGIGCKLNTCIIKAMEFDSEG